MTKRRISYANTSIYKICCKNKNVKDCYVGHTIHFETRKYQHMLSSKNVKNNLKVYKIIRKNGGWANWEMMEIAKYNCIGLTDARKKEQFHYEELNANMNSCPPYIYKENQTITLSTTRIEYVLNKLKLPIWNAVKDNSIILASEDKETTQSELDNNYYVIKSIIGKKIDNKTTYYLIWWKNYKKSESTWEPKKELIKDGAKYLLDAYEKKMKEK